ncbi:MAG: hypothetical protein CMI29_04890 [Opitutae bacterium]|nr:hypothetical protein [Opitutae bacterium]|tara:strand:+ start:1070 stop:1255 length:186 start_codon:yes stop_codon:yes gene_type:complete
MRSASGRGFRRQSGVDESKLTDADREALANRPSKIAPPKNVTLIALAVIGLGAYFILRKKK